MAKRAKTPSVLYETTDTSIAAVTAFFVGLSLFLILAAGVSWVIDRALKPINSQQVSDSPMARRQRLPPEPRLQVRESYDLIRLNDVEDVILNHYHWKDPEAGSLTLPIERAMELTLQEGLPHRPKGNSR